jgi:hypothetical protein
MSIEARHDGVGGCDDRTQTERNAARKAGINAK